MNPVKFPEQNAVLTSDSPEIRDLPVLRHSQGFISVWKMTPFERIKALLFGRVYFYAMTTQHPPINLIVQRTLPKNETQ